MAAAAAAVELLSPGQRQPLVVPTLWRQKRNICIFGGVSLLAFTLSVISCVRSSNMDMASVKPGTRLHIVPDQELLKKVQAEAYLTCDDTCLEWAGKVLIVTYSYQYIKQICGYPEGEEPPTFCAGHYYTPRAFTEQPGVVDGTEVASILLACLTGCFVVVLFPVIYCVLHCQEKSHKRVQQVVNRYNCPTFRMSLSGASVVGHADLVWGPGGLMRRKLTILFPFLDLLLPFPMYICAAVIRDERLLFVLIAVGITSGVMMVRFVILLCYCCKHARRTVRPQVQEIAFFCYSDRQVPQVCIVFDRRLTVFRNIGNLPQRPPAAAAFASSIIGRSQLVPQREDPSDEGSRIVGWSLRVISGTVAKDDTWEVLEHFFPVDPARAHAFRQWLSETPQRRWFRFCGTASSRDDVWPANWMTLVAPYTAGNGVLDPEAGNAAADPETLPPLDRLQTLVLNSRWREESPGKLSVVFTTLGGTVAAELKARATDTVADFLREVAVQPCFNSNQVIVVLPDGRTLEKVDARAKLGEVLRSLPV